MIIKGRVGVGGRKRECRKTEILYLRVFIYSDVEQTKGRREYVEGHGSTVGH